MPLMVLAYSRVLQEYKGLRRHREETGQGQQDG